MKKLFVTTWIASLVYSYAAFGKDDCHVKKAGHPTIAAWMPRNAYTTPKKGGKLWEMNFHMGEHFDNFISAAKKGCVNTIFLSVYSGGKTLWNSKAYMALSKNPETVSKENWAAQVKTRLESEGFNVVAWFEYGLALGRPDHPIFTGITDKKQWFQYSKTKKTHLTNEHGLVFLSPTKPKPKAFIKSLLIEVAEQGFKHIQLDRFRFALDCNKNCGPNYITSFGEEARDSFQAARLSLSFDDYRRCELYRFVVNSIREIKKVNPKILVSMAPLDLVGSRRSLQNWGAFGKYLDYIFPQVYAYDLDGFQNNMINLENKIIIPNKLDKNRIAIGIRVANSASASAMIAAAYKRSYRHLSYWLYAQ